jgi:signal transduction histidine kinase
MGREPVDIQELRHLFLFAELDDDKLGWLAEQGEVACVDAGTLVYEEGEPAECFYVLLEGTVSLLRRVQGDDIEINRTDQVGVYAGATQAYVGDRVPQRYLNSMRAVTDVRLFVLPGAAFTHMVREWFPMAMHLLEGLYFGLQATQSVVSQRERLLALGSLTAGLTHELNNPAAAAGRAAAELRERVDASHAHLRRMLAAPDGTAWVRAVVAFELALIERASATPGPDHDDDGEEELCDWLDAHHVPDPWEAGATLAEVGVGRADLEELAEVVPAEELPDAIAWVATTVGVRLLTKEVDEALGRITNLVDAARQYSQMDRAPLQETRLDELLDATLTMLSRKVPEAVTVVRDYDPDLGPIPVYAAELNQVWTNLIVNALYAMGGEGTLTVRTGLDGDCQVVEVIDTGPGVPPELTRRIFDPFFSTKPVGDGTGLGLDISYRIVVNRHHGDLTVDSRPGHTVFRVALPSTR